MALPSLGNKHHPIPPPTLFNPINTHQKPTSQILTSNPSNPHPHSKNHLNPPPLQRPNPYTLPKTTSRPNHSNNLNPNSSHLTFKNPQPSNNLYTIARLHQTLGLRL